MSPIGRVDRRRQRVRAQRFARSVAPRTFAARSVVRFRRFLDHHRVPVAEEIRQAIAVWIEQRRNDEQFRVHLRQSIDDNEKIFDRLAR